MLNACIHEYLFSEFKSEFEVIHQINLILQPLTQRRRPRLQGVYLLSQKQQILLILNTHHAIPSSRPSGVIVVFHLPGYLRLD